ncbi:hypothetical protein [Novosphingobium acidiphilum]|uniref:hypothetical protein n=1 Tax=Novosphingobium acidiphilum TaxID=505248 RepID=UPI00048A9D80|nr:hypothetical protein [Novosphingobium acidiphilum]
MDHHDHPARAVPGVALNPVAGEQGRTTSVICGVRPVSGASMAGLYREGSFEVRLPGRRAA